MSGVIDETGDFDRVIIITVDCLRWDFHEPYKDLFPTGKWFRGTAQASWTPTSHGSLFTATYPQRHGVFNFGDAPDEDTLFDISDAVSLSAITSMDEWVIPIESAETYGGHICPPWVTYEDDDTWQYEQDRVVDEFMHLFGEYDVYFVHDWVVHGSDPIHDVKEYHTMDSDDPVRKNREAYSKQVDFSIEANKEFLDELKDKGLYEGTLFVVWGDHGQGFGEDPEDTFCHHTTADEYVNRVPIAFCSTEFDEEMTDVDTNPESVDVIPTLRSFVEGSSVDIGQFDRGEHGVSLLDEVPSQLSYAISPDTPKNGLDDAVFDTDLIYREDQQLKLFKSFPESDELRMEEIEDSVGGIADKYKRPYEDFRSLSTQSGRTEITEVNTDFLKDMGYL